MAGSLQRRLIAGVLAVGTAGAAQTASAHDWYPHDCCSGHDCYPVDAEEIEVLPNGWRIIRTGETVPFGQTTKRPWERESMDGQFHRCSLGGDPDAETLCLFVPAMGS